MTGERRVPIANIGWLGDAKRLAAAEKKRAKRLERNKRVAAKQKETSYASDNAGLRDTGGETGKGS